MKQSTIDARLRGDLNRGIAAAITDSTGQSAPDHEGTDQPILISEDQLSVYIANTAHLVLHKLRKEMHAEINKQVDRLRIDHEKRWEQTRAQLKDLVRMETIL